MMLLSTPASYDLRTMGIVSPVKDQGSCGSCWTFGTFGCLEGWLLKSGKGLRDFSEEHLKDYHGFDPTPCAGGNEYMSTAYLARWCGPLNESDDPYFPDETRRPSNGLIQNKLTSELIFSTSANIKNALMNYGAGYVTMYYVASSYNATTNTYYYKGTSATNHAVTLVGWDDNKAVSGAKTPGAWLIKNSWGAAWGNQGYFWISYLDSKAVKYAVFFQTADTSTYANNYQYDPLGYCTSVGYGTSTTAWAANVFTAKGNEDLMAVSFYAVAQNMTYQVSVYHSFNGTTFSNQLGTTSGSINAGYQTIILPSKISLAKGDTFGIVVKFSGSTYPVPMEDVYAGYSSAATSQPGESFVSNTGTSFTDLTTSFPKANVCIKGFTTNRNSPPQAKNDSATSDGGAPVIINVLANDTDPDGDTIRIIGISSATLGSAVIVNDSSVSYTPSSGSSGRDSMAYFISDTEGGKDTAMIYITINAPTNAPVITSLPPANATEHVQWVYSPTATNPTQGVLTWSLSNQPQGMAIDPSTGQITWTPGEGVTSSGLVTLTVDNDQTPSLSGSQQFIIAVTPVNDPPIVKIAAMVAPSPVLGKTAALTVLGDDDGGEAALMYSWSTIGVPPAAVSFAGNGTNAAKNTTATFAQAGSYSFQVIIQDAGALTCISSVSVIVDQTVSAIIVSPSSASVQINGTQQFTAAVSDQFGALMSVQPAISWTVSGGGTIGGTGLFTATTAGGPFTVTAASGSVNGLASVTVTSTVSNLALKGTASSKTQQSGHAPALAIDNNTTTRWCASSGASNEWLKIDLGAIKSCTGTDAMWEFNKAYKYKIEVSTDNAAWTTVVDKTANTASAQTFKDSFIGSARYVRITATTLPSGSWASLYEFRVWGY
jgi:Cysteine protease